MGKMKIKAKAKGDIVGVKVLVKHDMLTYDQAKAKGKEANFITHISAKVGDRLVYDVSTSQFWSKNPQFKFKFKKESIKKGDKIEITWRDLSGKTVSEKKKIKGL
jgi:sulfur-oxidizing protein SoxZ